MRSFTSNDVRTLQWFCKQALWQLEDLLRFAHATESISGLDHMTARKGLAIVENVLKELMEQEERKW